MIDKIIHALTGVGITLMKGYEFLKAGTIEFYNLANFTYRKKCIAFAAICATVALTALWPAAWWLLALAPVAFIQNMFFTLVSRSRNSQDTDYHRFCAWGSNGVWFVCQVMIVKNIWGAIHAGQWYYAIMAGIVYSLATTEGSVLMMKRLIATEKGKRRVGASDKMDKMEQRIQVLERMINVKVAPKIETKNTLIRRVVNAVSTEKVVSDYEPTHPLYYRHGGKKS